MNDLASKYRNIYCQLTDKQKEAFDVFFDFNLFDISHDDISLATFDYDFNKTINRILSEELGVTHGLDISSALRPDILEELIETGYSKDKLLLDQKTTDRLRDGFLSLTFVSRDGNVRDTGNKIMSRVDELSKLSNIGSDTFWVPDQNTILEIPEVQEIIYDREVIDTVSRYLGCPPILAQLSAWISLPTLNVSSNLNYNAQLFHQDKEFTKFIKIFVYLNDVGEGNGPHWYVEKSHRDELIGKGVRFSTRLTDKEVLKYYSKEQLKCAIGRAGSVVFGDTCAVHKGARVKTGHRFMLQLEFSASLLQSPVETFDKKSSFYVNRRTDNLLHSRVFDNFSENTPDEGDCRIYKIDRADTTFKAMLKRVYYKIVKFFI